MIITFRVPLFMDTYNIPGYITYGFVHCAWMAVTFILALYMDVRDIQISIVYGWL